MAKTISVSKMALLKLQKSLASYRRYLPSLNLKRQQLRLVLSQITFEKKQLDAQVTEIHQTVYEGLPGLQAASKKYADLIKLESIEVIPKSIAGVQVSVVNNIVFNRKPIDILKSPLWVIYLQEKMEALISLTLRIQNLLDQICAVESALLKVTQRINLFEKLLIPQTQGNIKVIELSLSERARESVIVAKLCKSRSMSHHDYC